MIEPINIWRYIVKNYQVLKEDYNILPLVFCFFIIPLIFSVIVMGYMAELDIGELLNKSLAFFSIIIGFLINVLVLILTKKVDYTDKKLDEKITKLKRHISFNIINSIVIGISLILLIIFYNQYSTYNLVVFIAIFLFFHFVILLLNIVRKFGVYIETNLK